MKFKLTVLLLGVALLGACKKDYEKVKQAELATGVRNDSLFLGYHFGMSRQDFFKHSFDLNQQGLVTNGPQNITILYVIEKGKNNDYPDNVQLNFYPDFADEKIYRMRMYFSYEAWAPWNKQFYAVKAIPTVKDFLSKLFGPGDYLEVGREKGPKRLMRVNGNREIAISVEDDQHVLATVTDLTVTPPAQPAAGPRPGDQRPAWEKHQ